MRHDAFPRGRAVPGSAAALGACTHRCEQVDRRPRFLRATSSPAAGQFRDLRQLAGSAAICRKHHVQAGRSATATGVRLHAIHARALAAHGDSAQARAAMAAAGKARTGAHRDELHDGVAGEFAFDDAKLYYYEALTPNDADDPVHAEHAAAVAISLYQAVPARARSYGCEALARVQLARAQLMSSKLEDAAQALGGVLALDPQMRIGSLSQYLDACRQLLRLPAYRSSATARHLEQQLAAFSGASAAQALPGRR
jgi:hypothetical protein